MTTVIFVDSRMRTIGTDSDFEIDLRESVHLSNARLRVDKLTFTDSFLTTDAGAHLYFSNGAGGISYVTIPEGAYTGPTLAATSSCGKSRAFASTVATPSTAWRTRPIIRCCSQMGATGGRRRRRCYGTAVSGRSLRANGIAIILLSAGDTRDDD